MRDKDLYSLLYPFVDNYFRGNDYSIDDFSTSKRKEILSKSIVYVEYNKKDKTLFIINSKNDEDFIGINFQERYIEGSVSFDFDSNSDINYFDNVEEYIYNSELIRQVLLYTSLGIFGRIKSQNSFSIVIEEYEQDSDYISMPISKIFKNDVEFVSLFNISRNTVVNSADRFCWVLYAAAILAKVSKRTYNFTIKAVNCEIRDNDVAKLRKLNMSNIEGVQFVKCKILCKDKANFEFLEHLSI